MTLNYSFKKKRHQYGVLFWVAVKVRPKPYAAKTEPFIKRLRGGIALPYLKRYGVKPVAVFYSRIYKRAPNAPAAA